eukprot:364643-Chlamydomonas_euryale.AAC.2
MAAATQSHHDCCNTKPARLPPSCCKHGCRVPGGGARSAGKPTGRARHPHRSSGSNQLAGGGSPIWHLVAQIQLLVHTTCMQQTSEQKHAATPCGRQCHMDSCCMPTPLPPPQKNQPSRSRQKKRHVSRGQVTHAHAFPPATHPCPLRALRAPPSPKTCAALHARPRQHSGSAWRVPCL